MSLSAGTRLGPYEIVSAIGAGGMGEVYRARDTTLNRDVAIKVLPDAFAADADRLARFTREAHVLASLNHPHIAAIYGIEANAIVMELVDGDDLSAVIARGPIPIGEALRIAGQVIDALEAAHDANVIHRDLKPANIKIRADGNVKVLDFGLAKAVDPGGASGADPMNSPTMTARATEMGMVIGTAAYMSPEQAKARPVDRRADIWAFGALLYEMLTGQRAFPGDTASETIANVLKESPDWSRLPAATPAGVRRLLARTLDRDVRRRLQAIGDARIELEDRSPDPSVPARRGVPLIAALGLALVGLAGWALWLGGASRSGTAAPLIRLSITPPGRLTMVRQSSNSDANSHWAFSADGTQIAFVVQQGATRFLMVRALDRFDARLLPGTEGADLPFWSPDGSAIGFFADGKMKRVSVTGDAVRTICDCAVSAATWGPGVILFGKGGYAADGGHAAALSTVPDTGGIETPLPLAGPKGESSGAWPFFLPDGRRFVYLNLTPNPADRMIMLGSLDATTARPLVKSAFKARYASTGQLIYLKDGVLVAQHLDVDRAELTGPVTPLVDDMLVAEVPGQAQYEASLSGAVAYQTRGPAVPSSLTWIGRDGRPGESVMEPDTFITLDLAKDGRQMLFATGDNSVENEEPPSLVWQFDFVRKVRTRVR
ncbi:MAG: serine/threonine protein kinase, partial [Acidobacteria bacterium]